MRMLIIPNRKPSTPADAAERLRRELEDFDVAADVHADSKIALVSVWADLVVWCDATSYRWWSGRTSPRGRVMAFCPADDPATAARRIVRRLVELQDRPPMTSTDMS
ncbi:hypothetical protein AB0G06_34660 [Nonomuraea dietziae]|uniref:hypothetical protein n=1 Tax=Nonomuraea dietziae TaxID=65515 RepID=UPI00340AB9DC